MEKGGRPMDDEDESTAEELGKHISDYVRGLTEKQRYIFMSRYYFAEPTESIANDLRLTKSSIYKELTRIKNGLREHLERNGIYV